VNQFRRLHSGLQEKLNMIQPLGTLKGSAVWNLASLAGAQIVERLETRSHRMNILDVHKHQLAIRVVVRVLITSSFDIYRGAAEF
jgi:hypothetical protein